MTIKTSKTNKINCIVTRKGFVVGGDELKVGDKVSLTESQMATFVGKVETIDEAKAKAAADELSPAGIKGLQAANLKQAARIEELEVELENRSKTAKDEGK